MLHLLEKSWTNDYMSQFLQILRIYAAARELYFFFSWGKSEIDKNCSFLRDEKQKHKAKTAFEVWALELRTFNWLVNFKVWEYKWFLVLGLLMFHFETGDIFDFTFTTDYNTSWKLEAEAPCALGSILI